MCSYYSGGSPEQLIGGGGVASEAFGVEQHGGGGVVPHYEYSKVVCARAHILSTEDVCTILMYSTESLVSKQSDGARNQLPSPDPASGNTIAPLSGWQLPSSTLLVSNVMAPRLGPIGQQRQTGPRPATSTTV